MSALLTDVPWDIEERVEDALVAYIKANVPGVKMVVAAREIIIAGYPLIVVDAGDSAQNDDRGQQTARRRMNVIVALATEAVNRNGDTGEEEFLETARETHRRLKSGLIAQLAGSKLHERLNDLQPEGVLFSQAHMTTQSRDAGDGKLVTEQTIDVIAQPREI